MSLLDLNSVLLKRGSMQRVTSSTPLPSSTQPQEQAHPLGWQLLNQFTSISIRPRLMQMTQNSVAFVQNNQVELVAAGTALNGLIFCARGDFTTGIGLILMACGMPIIANHLYPE